MVIGEDSASKSKRSCAAELVRQEFAVLLTLSTHFCPAIERRLSSSHVRESQIFDSTARNVLLLGQFLIDRGLAALDNQPTGHAENIMACNINKGSLSEAGETEG